jgi:hypothetical protein
MLSPRKKYIYGAIFGVACVGFMIDRMIGPGPEEAGAKETTTGSSKAPAPSPSANTADGSKPSAVRNETSVAPEPVSPAAQGIKRLPEITQVRDLFRPMAAETAPSEAEQVRRQETEADVVAAFVAAYRLQGTFHDGAVRVAMVNGRTLRPGQVIGGFRLEQVETFRVVFRKDGREAVLAMPENGTGPETRGSGK